MVWYKYPVRSGIDWTSNAWYKLNRFWSLIHSHFEAGYFNFYCNIADQDNFMLCVYCSSLAHYLISTLPHFHISTSSHLHIFTSLVSGFLFAMELFLNLWNDEKNNFCTGISFLFFFCFCATCRWFIREFCFWTRWGTDFQVFLWFLVA